jgi:dihydrofolate synthase/folylpolyglutamate synthase
MEIVQIEPTVLLDGAHNIDKIKAASADVSKTFPYKQRIVVFALKQGKKLQEIIPYVVQNAAKLILTTFSNDLWKSLSPEAIAKTARFLTPERTILVEPDPMKALEIAIQLAKPEDLVWVTGSLYLVGNIRNHWHPTHKLLKNHHSKV